MKASRLFKAIILILTILAEYSFAQIWVSRAEEKSIEVKIFSDEDYESYAACIKEKGTLVWDKCQYDSSSKELHHNNNLNDMEYHGSTVTLDYLKENTEYVISVKGVYGSPKFKTRTVGGTEGKTGTYSPGESEVIYRDYITHGGGVPSRKTWKTGDFDGDSVDDFILFFNDQDRVSMDVYTEEYSSSLQKFEGKYRRWKTRNGGYLEGHFLVADYNNDGKDDVARVWNNQGRATVQTYLSNGSSFNDFSWVKGDAGPYFTGDLGPAKWFAGDFTGDGNADIVRVGVRGYYVIFDILEGHGNNTFSNLIRFQDQLPHAILFEKDIWMAGDFNGDQIQDIVVVRKQSNKSDFYLYESFGSGFNYGSWAQRQGGMWDGQKWFVTDFDGDGADDVGKAFWSSGGSTTIDIHYSRFDHFEMARVGNRDGAWHDDAVFLGGRFHQEDHSQGNRIGTVFRLNSRFAIGTY